MIGEIQADRLLGYADLLLRCGVDIGDGQKLLIIGGPEHRELIDALTERAYAHGASVAYPLYRDARALRAQATHAATDELARQVPPWSDWIVDLVIRERWATIVTVSGSGQNPYAGAPSARVSALLASLNEQWLRQINADLNWTYCACPTAEWAEGVYGERDVERLWRDLRFMLRLDEPDPNEAWNMQQDELARRAQQLNAAEFSTVRFRGEGTDLIIPLHSDARWIPGRFTTSFGRRCIANMPTEEIFTTPDFRGVRGTVVATRPVLVDGARVEGLVMRFERGRIVDVSAKAGEDAVRAQISHDPGACRLGEIALVDGTSRIGQMGRMYGEILIDENATCHIAWGHAFDHPFPRSLSLSAEEREQRGVNVSVVHQDVMVGGPSVGVFGEAPDGSEIPILLDERWQL